MAGEYFDAEEVLTMHRRRVFSATWIFGTYLGVTASGFAILGGECVEEEPRTGEEGVTFRVQSVTCVSADEACEAVKQRLIGGMVGISPAVSYPPG